ncbi:MAG: response regulator [Sphingobacteriales bacterium JAD_PAG50586_3]|nr:MAG: response regulator [Sphingobacteriales bacterium JAD_PAG50586_3]
MKKPYSFILIDDEPVSNELSAIQIRRVFPEAKTVSFSDPKEAIDSIEHHYADYEKHTTILLDINMPYSGWKVLEGFESYTREVYQHFIIYILSSTSSTDDAERARKYPLVKAVLQKPITKQDLLDMFKDNELPPFKVL